MSDLGNSFLWFFFGGRVKDLKAVSSESCLQLTHLSDQVLLTVSQFDKNMLEVFLNSETALKIYLILIITNCSVSDLFLRIRLMKTLQHINRTQSHHSNPIKIRANADMLHSLNSMNVTENLAEPRE